jgi:hypothetical protein
MIYTKPIVDMRGHQCYYPDKYFVRITVKERRMKTHLQEVKDWINKRRIYRYWARQDKTSIEPMVNFLTKFALSNLPIELPSLKGISDDEMWAVAEFLLTTFEVAQQSDDIKTCDDVRKIMILCEEYC